MHEPFVVSVIYQGNEHEFKARFERWGYTHRIAVLVDETTIIFEPDDEQGGYRAMPHPELSTLAAYIDISLLEAIAKKLADLNK